ncbi:MAG TPA: excinuclease ABC subunit UvrA [Anaerolineae bacterium]|nr:excinuclease ABC subunit UvrA [Anaerolineae bacterium]HQI85199.1 excinuclease ABC subunit UvrA [Anaerolineae bacterium]
MTGEKLIVRGAREHNLKNITVEIPKNKLVVITGLSGSGKSSLAFDTIFAEGQRRYIESLSAYARQFLGQMNKPDVDSIEGLSPAIAIDQKGVSHNPRSTVGTVTEIYDYLRLLYARIGIPHCPDCGRPVTRQSAQEIVDAILAMPPQTRLQVLAPLVRGRKGHHRPTFDEARKLGFVRVRVDRTVYELEEVPELDRYKIHDVEAVVDRLVVPDAAEKAQQIYRDFVSRVTDSVETSLRLGEGVLIVDVVRASQPEVQPEGDVLFSEKLACPVCGRSLPEIEPRTFSFNSPHGACPTCQGLGFKLALDPDLIVPNPNKSIAEGAIVSNVVEGKESYHAKVMESVMEYYGIAPDKPWSALTDAQRHIVLYGSGQEAIPIYYEGPSGVWAGARKYDGIIPSLQRRYDESTSDFVREKIEEVMSQTPCATCHGTRLSEVARAVTVLEQPIYALTGWPVLKLQAWVETLLNGNVLTAKEYAIAERALREIHSRISFLVNVGLDYLSLDRAAATLSGGEAQRIRLATQVGSRLTGVLYVLDEPSVGLHQRDTARLIATLKEMRDLGNTVLVVEHDDETIRSADWIVDLGPGAGEHGGEVVAEGTLDEILAHPTSNTGAYLSGRKCVPVPAQRRQGNGKALWVRGARQHNLKNLDVRFPLGLFTVVTGVSGSGKSSLIVETLYTNLLQRLDGSRNPAGDCDGLEGVEYIDKVINIDQSPIGRTPRSNPATYTGTFDPIRSLFAELPESKIRGYNAGRFSFNVKGGRCEACQGQGTLRIEMQFLPEVYVPCDVCHGTRYNRETLQVRYKEKNIAEVLDMTVTEAVEFFAAIPSLVRKLETLCDVGLGYIRLGQSATTLSGGEAQRIKLAKELSRRATGRTLYILDEPTVGLHAADVDKLITVLQRLADAGNTILVIEHNPDVIKVADWIIDMGPEGGDAGGELIIEGTPEEVAQSALSHTGQYLKRWLKDAQGMVC